jgi:hypothetical protein
MPPNYLHNLKDFGDLLRIISENKGIDAHLIEKDYWIMHVLYGLKKQGFEFELKGGTSLSKGYKIIHRFSEDVDIHIRPPSELGINENPKNTKPNNILARKNFYNWLSNNIQIDGIVSVNRDHLFDDKDYYRSGGIRLNYNSITETIPGIKQGILLEAGFDTITPNSELMISSWAYDTAIRNTEIIDNRAMGVACYHPGYTLVEKLQTIVTKYRQEKSGEKDRPNFMRQYYDVFCLLDNSDVQAFIGTKEYRNHIQQRFPKIDLDTSLNKNQALLLSNPIERAHYKKRYIETNALYYNGQPAFEDVLERIRQNLDRL